MSNTSCLQEKATQIMTEATDKAGELLVKKPQIAEIILKQVLKCDPEHSSALQLLGLCKHRMGQHAEAVEIIQTALDIDPDNADNWNNLGLAYGGLGNHKKSIDCIKKAIQKKPNQFLFKNNLALQFRSINDYDSAIESLKEGLKIEEQPQMWLNLGGMYGELKKLSESEQCFRNALKLDPNYAAAYVDLAFVYHLLGDWKKGFAAYEWRFFYYPQMRFYHNSYDHKKLWDGKSSLKNKKVLVYGEQGLGDIIQFVRYAKNLKEMGAYVIIHCPKSLDSIVKRIEGVDETTNKDIVNIDENEKFPDYDYQFSMMSFPYLLNLEEIDGNPYIKPATDRFKNFIKKDYKETFNIGIVWAGSPAHPHDKKRSIPLKHFRILHDAPNVKLFSLQLENSKRQYGATYRNIEANSTKVDDACFEKFQPIDAVVDYSEDCEDLKIVDLTKMIQSFEDTATILAGLDLLICCDTATAHMAGAMGVPVWVAVPYNPDWRWTLQGNETHWYNSMKLYRQENKDDWEEVFRKIRRDLDEIVLQNK